MTACKKRRIPAVLLAVFMLVALLPAVAAAAETYTVTYAPGEHGIFAEQVYTVTAGDVTPHFFGVETGEPDDDPFTPPEDNEGWYFAGWDTEPAAAVTADVTYTAQWEQRERTIDVKVSGAGSGANDILWYDLPKIPAFRITATGVVGTGEDSKKFKEFRISIKPDVFSLDPYETVVPAVPIPEGKNQHSLTEVSLKGYTFALRSERDGLGRDQIIWLHDMQYTPFDVKYLPGEHGAFQAQYFDNITPGDPTPVFEGGTPGKDGYEFAGWDVTPADTVTADTVYTATWKQPAPTEHTVTFYDGTGENAVLLKTETVPHGAAATAPELQPQEGYEFDSWDKDFSHITADLSVHARWEKIVTHTVEFLSGDDADAELLASETVPHGASATAPADPVREGFTFNGWDSAFNHVTADLVVRARWTAKPIIALTMQKQVQAADESWGQTAGFIGGRTVNYRITILGETESADSWAVSGVVLDSLYQGDIPFAIDNENPSFEFTYSLTHNAGTVANTASAANLVYDEAKFTISDTPDSTATVVITAADTGGNDEDINNEDINDEEDPVENNPGNNGGDTGLPGDTGIIPAPVPGGNVYEEAPVTNNAVNTLMPQTDEDGGTFYVEIGDDDVPLGEWHWNGNENLWIYDEYPPLSGPPPLTGDAAGQTTQLLAVLLLSLLGLVLTYTAAKKIVRR